MIRRSTIEAAKAIGWDDRVGSLGVGREADVAVLSLDGCDTELKDCQGQLRQIDRRLVPRAVWKAGEPGVITEPHHGPDQRMLTPAC